MSQFIYKIGLLCGILMQFICSITYASSALFDGGHNCKKTNSQMHTMIDQNKPLSDICKEAENIDYIVFYGTPFTCKNKQLSRTEFRKSKPKKHVSYPDHISSRF